MSTYDPNKEYKCFVTGEIIPSARVEYLLSEGTPEHMLTSLKGSEKIHKPRKMIVVDDEFNHIICDHIDETRIYAKERFGSAVEAHEEEEVDEVISNKKPAIIEDKEEDEE
jgi:hypothetical protein